MFVLLRSRGEYQQDILTPYVVLCNGCTTYCCLALGLQRSICQETVPHHCQYLSYVCEMYIRKHSYLACIDILCPQGDLVQSTHAVARQLLPPCTALHQDGVSYNTLHKIGLGPRTESKSILAVSIFPLYQLRAPNPPGRNQKKMAATITMPTATPE